MPAVVTDERRRYASWRLTQPCAHALEAASHSSCNDRQDAHVVHPWLSQTETRTIRSPCSSSMCLRTHARQQDRTAVECLVVLPLLIVPSCEAGGRHVGVADLEEAIEMRGTSNIRTTCRPLEAMARRGRVMVTSQFICPSSQPDVDQRPRSLCTEMARHIDDRGSGSEGDLDTPSVTLYGHPVHKNAACQWHSLPWSSMCVAKTTVTVLKMMISMVSVIEVVGGRAQGRREGKCRA